MCVCSRRVPYEFMCLCCKWNGPTHIGRMGALRPPLAEVPVSLVRRYTPFSLLTGWDIRN